MPAKTILRAFLSCMAFLLCTGFSAIAQKRQIRVAAASDLQTVMPEVAAAFEGDTGTRVELIFGSSGNLFAQLQNGAPFDVFFSADNEFPVRLIQSGRAEPRSAEVYALGRLVLWLPRNAKCDPQEEKWNCLLKPEISKIAIANPAHAPYGRAAVNALQSAHVYEQVRTKLVLGENISQAAQFVQSGNAQAGLVAYSQAHSPAMRDGRLWDVPQKLYPPIEQTAVILKVAKDQDAAADFLRFVTEGRGRALLEKSGFHLPANTQSPARHK